MTIRTHVPCAEPNRRLNLIEACIDNAPTGTFEDAKALRDIIGDTADALLAKFKALGLVTPNCDQIREVEAVIYGYITDANPLAFADAEGFGAAMDTDAKDRVIANMARDRDFLDTMGMLQREEAEDAGRGAAEQRA